MVQTKAATLLAFALFLFAGVSAGPLDRPSHDLSAREFSDSLDLDTRQYYDAEDTFFAREFADDVDNLYNRDDDISSPLSRRTVLAEYDELLRRSGGRSQPESLDSLRKRELETRSEYENLYRRGDSKYLSMSNIQLRTELWRLKKIIKKLRKKLQSKKGSY